jgi:DNA polymerase-3 subunit alpha
MEKYLKESYGVTIYQEQIMNLSRLLSNFTREESDILRKALGKKKQVVLDVMKPKFIEGGRQNGHDSKILEKIWNDWEVLGPYAFCKSHAVCYTWLAYQTAYLKAHYPDEYMSALLKFNMKDMEEFKRLKKECERMEIQLI